jgi:peptidoglycan/LPS O-acetylase OafA/YrhL
MTGEPEEATTNAPPVTGQVVSGGSLTAATVINEDLSHWIDLFRWSAAFAVVLAHGNRFVDSLDQKTAHHRALGITIYKFIMAFSHPGIMIFFVISGFLVGGTAWREVERTGTIDVARFLQRRLIRLWIVIVPALVATLLFDSYGRSLGGVSNEIYAGANSLGFGTATCNLAFLQTVACDTYGTDGALWTLYNEFWYYLLCIALLLLLRAKDLSGAKRAGLVGFIAIVCAASFFQREGVPMLPYFAIWVLGALAAGVRRPMLDVPAPLLLVVVLVALVGWRVGTGMSLYADGGVPLFVFDVVVMGLFAAFLAKLRFAPLRLHPLIARPSVAFAGGTFTLYCFHVPLMNVMAAVMEHRAGMGWRDVRAGADWARLVAEIGFVVLVCYGLSRLTEARTDQFRKLLLRERRKPEAASLGNA